MLKKILNFAAVPVLTGSVVALGLALLLDREATPQTNQRTNSELNQAQNERLQAVSYADAVNKAAPSVVNIYTKKDLGERVHPLLSDPRYRRFFNRSNIPQQQRMESALGSGVVVRRDGYVITNFHVIDGADEIVVALQDGRQAKARVFGESREYDMAVLKVDLDNLTPISIGDPENAQVGDVVLAIGNPFGVGQTVTQGIISGTRRKDLNISFFENFIQTDAAINPGNSGGALVDAYGNLLGINIANLETADASGIGFAIPADKAIQTLEDIIEFGRVLKGWLGVAAGDITAQIARAESLPSLNGIWITDVYKDGPADEAGLRAGDVIVAINQQAVNNTTTGWKEIASSRPGDKVHIQILRGGETIILTATLGTVPRV